MNFVRKIPDYGDLIPINDWKEDVSNGFFTDYDGNGHWAKDGKMTDGLGDNVCSIEAIDLAIKEGVTHVCWFNK